MALTTNPRWDKYYAYVGNFRVPLALDVNLTTQINRVWGVGVNASGALVIGAGQSGIAGVAIFPVGKDMNGAPLSGTVGAQAGDVVDVGKHGEITNFKTTTAAGVQAAAVAGTKYYAHADGSVDATAAAGIYIGHTVEADRLIVNVIEV